MVYSCLCILNWDRRNRFNEKIHTSTLNAHKQTEQQQIKATLWTWRQLPPQMSKGSIVSTFQFVAAFWQDIWPLFIPSDSRCAEFPLRRAALQTEKQSYFKQLPDSEAPSCISNLLNKWLLVCWRSDVFLLSKLRADSQSQRAQKHVIPI